MTNTLKRWMLPLAAVLLLLLLVAWMAGYFTEKIAPGVAGRQPGPGGETVSVMERTAAFTEPVPASVAAKEATVISSRILARITHIAVRAGDYVERGDVLIALEKTDLQAREKQALEQKRVISARLTEAEQALTRAEELRRKGLIAQADLDQADANARALRAVLASAEQALRQARTVVGYTDITAPLAGRVVDRFAEPGDTASPGQKLLTLYNPFSLRVEAQVREGLALSLKTGDTLTVEVPALPAEFSSTIEELVPAADPGSRSFLVKAVLPSDDRLLPGMYARVQVPAGQRRRLLVPLDRVARVGQLDVVWVKTQAGPSRRFVRLGPETADGLVEVIAGLSVEDKLHAIP